MTGLVSLQEEEETPELFLSPSREDTGRWPCMSTREVSGETNAGHAWISDFQPADYEE